MNAQKVVELRRARGWSQMNLAVETGLHVMTISELERGVVEPKVATISAIARALEVTVDDLLAEPDPEPVEATP